MRRLVTSLLVAAVAGIGAVAGIAALRDAPEGDPRSPRAPEAVAPRATAELEPLGGSGRFVAVSDRRPPAELSERSFAMGLLEAAGIAGRIYLSDERCRLRGYHLPTLDVQRLPEVRSCAFSLSDDGWLARGTVVWQRGGSLAAFCQDGAVEVLTRAGDPYDRFAGCAPAWRPDGMLTYVDAGAVRTWPGSGEIVSGVRLAEAAGIELAPGRVAVEQIAWLPAGRLVAVLGPTAAREGDVLWYEPDTHAAGVLARAAEIGELAASPTGDSVALRADGAALVVPAGEPGSGSLSLGAVDAFAWSPDGRWLAVAADSRLTFLPVGHAGTRRPSLGPITARDLAWRAG